MKNTNNAQIYPPTAVTVVPNTQARQSLSVNASVEADKATDERNMKLDELRIAIAEASGFDCRATKEALDRFKNRDGTSEPIFLLAKIPDYLNDLNAMHAAEEILSEEQLKQMCGFLMTQSPWRAMHATAYNRAKAFLRTLNFCPPPREIGEPTEKPDLTGLTLWQCPVCGHRMTEEQSKGYRGCPTGMHIAQHEPLEIGAAGTRAAGMVREEGGQWRYPTPEEEAERKYAEAVKHLTRTYPPLFQPESP